MKIEETIEMKFVPEFIEALANDADVKTDFCEDIREHVWVQLQDAIHTLKNSKKYFTGSPFKFEVSISFDNQRTDEL